jgi:hypothetical protein
MIHVKQVLVCVCQRTPVQGAGLRGPSGPSSDSWFNYRLMLNRKRFSRAPVSGGFPARLRISDDIRSWEAEVPLSSHERALFWLAIPLVVVSGDFGCVGTKTPCW